MNTHLHDVDISYQGSQGSHCIGLTTPAWFIARKRIVSRGIKGVSLHIWFRGPCAQQHFDRLDIPKSADILTYEYILSGPNHNHNP
jgi:hypothetical protein